MAAWMRMGQIEQAGRQTAVMRAKRRGRDCQSISTMRCNAMQCRVVRATRSGFQRTAGACRWMAWKSKWRVFGIIQTPTQSQRGGKACIFSVTLAPSPSRGQTAQAAGLTYPELNFARFLLPFRLILLIYDEASHYLVVGTP